MEKKGVLTKTLAIVGTALVWFPILAPVFFAAASLVSDGVLRFDYMMPAELGLFAIVGAGQLLWAALRAQTAYEQGVAMPLANVAKEVYALAVRSGLGEEDFSAIYRFLNDSAG